jgi:hypothetical protein
MNNPFDHDIYAGIPPRSGTVWGWNSDAPIFGELLERVRPKVIIEVGTWHGGSAIHMAGEAKKLGISPRIICVDTWLGAEEFWTTANLGDDRDLKRRNGWPEVYFDFLGNVVAAGHQDLIHPMPMSSTVGARVLAFHKILAGLIYIDASHDYDDVRSDIRNFRPLLLPGGVMFGDDYSWPSVARAVADEAPEAKDAAGFWLLDTPQVDND